MNTKVIYRDISIVLVSKINKETCNPIWMLKHGIITLEELQSIDNDKLIISKEHVQFQTSLFELTCTDEKLVIRSKDITLSNRLSDIALKIVACNNTKVNAIGINASSRFAFPYEPDFLKFCHHVAPLDGLAPLSDNALLLDMTVVDWSAPHSLNTPNKIYNIKRVQNLNNNVPVVQISMNYHHPQIDGDEMLESYLLSSPHVHNEFFTNSKGLIISIQ